MTIGLEHYLTVAAALFVIGIFGHLPEPQERHHHPDVDRADAAGGEHQPRRLLLLLGDLTGQVFTLFVLTVAAAEAAIGLAILVCFFRNRGTIAVEDVNVMKG
jgi:NADH-quinone oxidoreductase subunit K